MQELIKVRGFQVAPAELEGHLLDHPDVADVCVVAAPDEYSGELPFAFVVLHEQVRRRVAKSAQDEERVRQALLKVRTHVRSKETGLCLTSVAACLGPQDAVQVVGGHSVRRSSAEEPKWEAASACGSGPVEGGYEGGQDQARSAWREERAGQAMNVGLLSSSAWLDIRSCGRGTSSAYDLDDIICKRVL